MDPEAFRTVQEDQVAMQVVRHIRGLIEQGKLGRGERLAPEREFAKELKISRASLRAGVGYLAAMGVLKVRHGVGTFVADGPPALSSASFEMMYTLHGFTSRHMFETRLIIEGNLAALAAERGREEHFDALGDELADMEATLEDPQNYLIHDVSFHRIVGEASGNPILGALMETISASVYDTRRVNIQVSTNIRESAEAHRLIYQALRARRPEEARRLMEQHLRRAEEQLNHELAQAEAGSSQAAELEREEEPAGQTAG